MDVELKHTWRITRRAWYIRLYHWVWGDGWTGKAIENTEITFCRLWWGYVFMWFGLPITCVLLAFVHTVQTIQKGHRGLRHLLQRERELTSGHVAPQLTTVQDKSALGLFMAHSMRSLMGLIEHGAAWTGMQTAKGAWVVKSPALASGRGIKRAAKSIGRSAVYGLNAMINVLGAAIEHSMPVLIPVGRGLMVLGGGLGLVIWKVLELLFYPVALGFDLLERLDAKFSKTAVVSAWVTTGICVASWLTAVVLTIGTIVAHPLVIVAMIAGIGLLFGICLLMGIAVSYIASRFFAPPVYHYVVQPLGRGTSQGTVSFGRVMLIGIKSVKANTCPRVVIEE